MKQNILEEITSFSPSSFFAVSLELNYHPHVSRLDPLGKSYLLPDLSKLLSEESFAEIFLAWSEEGIGVQAKIDKPFESINGNDYRLSDSIELFFDTRDIKNIGFPMRFCHHFLILPSQEETSSCIEITQFKTEDKHSLCDSKDLKVDAAFQRKNYSVSLFIPSNCLHGYDPSSFDRLGFNYRINRFGGQPQNFSVSSYQFAPEQNPSLWSSCKLYRQ